MEKLVYLNAMLVSIRNFLKGNYSLYNENTNVLTQRNESVPSYLPYDRVDNISGIIHRNMQAHRGIVGIVDFLNRTNQGFSPRGVPLYMFHPLNEGYPPMIVSSKTKPTHNLLVKVNIEHWNVNDKWPRAGIQSIIGPVGNKECEQNACIQSVSIPCCNVLTDTIPSIGKHTVYDAFVFNIDPEGCCDVDDVILWKQLGNDIEFGIGIADVSSWVEEGSMLDTYAKQIGQTFYVDGNPVHPMLPNELSTLKASLRCDSNSRPILSLLFTIRGNECINRRWELQTVIVDKAYTYESIYSDSDVATKLQMYLEIVLGKSVGNDSHSWIEQAMILYNSSAASILKQNGNGLLRSHTKGFNADDWMSLALKTGCEELAYFGYGSGKYIPADEIDVRHTGLNLEVYSHVSSPLRRYADLHNQRWLKHILFQLPKPTHYANWNHLNEQNRKAKQLDRDLWLLNNLQANSITEVKGILLKKKENDESWSVYIPSWKRKIRSKQTLDDANIYEIGTNVILRVYTDLKATSFSNRYVCVFSLGIT